MEKALRQYEKWVSSPKVDKETKEALVADLEKSKNWRIDRLLGKTHEYKLDNILD